MLQDAPPITVRMAQSGANERLSCVGTLMLCLKSILVDVNLLMEIVVFLALRIENSKVLRLEANVRL